MKKLISFTILILLFSCKKDSECEYIRFNTPLIDFLEIEHRFDKDMLYNDIILTNLTFKYTDGYSNFGTPITDEIPIFNCTIHIYKKKNGNYYPLEYPFPLQLTVPEVEIGETGHFALTTHESYTKFQGQVKVDLEWPFQNPCEYYCPGDTFKYSVQIMDEDSLMSNIIEKESVIPLIL